MSLSEDLAYEEKRQLLYGDKPRHAIVKCVKYASAWYPYFRNPGETGDVPDAGSLEIGKIYDAYFCGEQGVTWVVINGKQYYGDGYGNIDFITTDFPQLEKLLFIGRKKCSLK